MALAFIDPNGPEFTHKYAQTNNLRYHYVEAGDPKGEPLLMVHGFPDLWYGWRYQIKFFAELGYRVIAVDSLGYGQTDSPMELEKYGFKALVSDLAGLLDAIDIPKITLLGHDWGGAIVWRFGLYFPERVNGIVSVCTPYSPPSSTYRTLEERIKAIPEFEYQRGMVDPATIAQMDNSKEETLKAVLASGGVDGKGELDYMVKEYSHNGFRGPLNYYKTMRVNFDDEIVAFPNQEQRIIHLRSWMIIAENDPYLKPRLAEKMVGAVTNVKMTSIPSGHFALTENIDQLNEILKSAVEDILSHRDAAKASL